MDLTATPYARAQPPAAALSAPAQLRDVLSTLREILAVYATSLLEQEGAPSSPQTRGTEFRDVLDASLDPALEMCSRMADMRPAEWDRAVFCINCDEAVLAALEGFDFVDQRRKAVQQDEEKYVETVTAAHVRIPSFLSRPMSPSKLTGITICDPVRPFAQRERARTGYQCPSRPGTRGEEGPSLSQASEADPKLIPPYLKPSSPV